MSLFTIGNLENKKCIVADTQFLLFSMNRALKDLRVIQEQMGNQVQWWVSNCTKKYPVIIL